MWKCLSITVETLRELGKLKGRVGTTILGAAVIDDIMGIIVLTVVTSIEDTSVNPFTVLLKIVLYFIVIAIVAFVMFKCKKLIEGAGEKRRVTIFAIAFCFLLSYVSEQFFGIADITGAYFAGLMLCNMKIGDYIKARAEVPSYLLFSPVFFARFDSSQTQRQINALYYVLTLFPPIARLLLRKLFGLLSFSSALAVCLSTLSKPNLIHRIESH